jgi:Spy/CpxP family protein refolding chaperone
MKRVKIVSILFVLASFVLSSATFATAQVDGLDADKLHLTDEQLQALGGILGDFHQKQLELTTQIEVKFIELRKELRKEGRFDTKIKETLSARKSNKIVTDISSLHGQLMRVRVEYLLKAKNVLNEEQRRLVVSSLEFDDDAFEEDVPDIFGQDLLLLPLDLTTEQIKKILKHQTDMEINALKINMKILYQLLDLKNEIIHDTPDEAKLDKAILNIVDLGNQLLDNRVKHFLKSKDVLTPAQKQRLIHAIVI